MPVGLVSTQHADRRVVCVDLGSRQHMAANGLCQGAEQRGRCAHPVSQGGALQIDTLAGVDLRQAIQRGVIGILAHQHMGQQAGAGHAAIDRSARCTGLHDAVARRAGQARPHMADDLELTEQVVEHFADVLANGAQCVQAGATGATCIGRVHHDLTRQVGGQVAQARASLA